jgi:putative nucleotidyltransferase with HDIG domain
MLNLVLIAENERERNILTIAFEQRGINVLHSESKFKNYVFVMQYLPDIIVIELPYFSNEQLDFTDRIRSFKRTRSIPIIGYGSAASPAVINGITKKGISIYLERPLKFTKLMQHIESLLKLQKKSLEPKPAVSEKEQDITLLLNSEAPVSQKIEVMVRHVSKLVAFPFTVAKVLKVTHDQQTGAQQLAKAITTDPYMTTYLLKVANSVFFARSNRRINSIKDAIVRIGFNETKRIVLSLSVMNLFDSKNKNSGFDRIDFWYHSLATAIIAERMAKNLGDLNLEEAFLAGLLHDLGIMLLDDFFPSIFDTILSTTAKEAGLFYNQEKQLLTVTHLDMIAELFPKWRIPQDITNSITAQYKIDGMNVLIDNSEKKIAVCVALGNAIAKLLHIGKECDEFVPPFNDPIFNLVKLPTGITPGFVEYVNEQVTYFSTFLSLEKRTYRCDYPDAINVNDIRVGVCNPTGSIFLPPIVFLKQHTMQYEMISAEKDFEEYHEKYHILMYWTNGIVDSSLCKRLQHIRRNNSIYKLASEADEQFAPLILFAPLQDPPTDKPAGSCLLFDNKLDYRLLESKIFELVAPL